MPALRIGASEVLAYDDYGSGPIIVLIHGSPGTSRVWQRVAERLAGRFRVLCPNLPGYGETTPTAADDAGPSHAAQLLEALARDVGPPLIVAGHSYGGVVALSMALRGKVAPRAVALFEPVAVPVLDAVGDVVTFAGARAVLDEYVARFERGDPEAVRAMVDYWFGADAFAQMPSPMQEYLRAHTAHNVRDVRATFREGVTRESLGGLSVPVLVVCGGRSPEVMRRICAAVASHAGRGHLAMLDEANHAMTTTHVDPVAGLLADLADGRIEGLRDASRPA